MSMIVDPQEFHISIRVAELVASTDFYMQFLGVEPKDRTARYSTFIVPHLRLNLVLLVNDKGEALDTYSLYHLGLGCTQPRGGRRKLSPRQGRWCQDRQTTPHHLAGHAPP